MQILHETQQNHIQDMKEVSHLLWIWTSKYDRFTTCFIAEQMKRLWEEVVVINRWMQKFSSQYFSYMWLVSFYCVMRSPLLLLRSLSSSFFPCLSVSKSENAVTRHSTFFNIKRHTSLLLMQCHQEWTSTYFYST